jgi:hypothetical protein
MMSIFRRGHKGDINKKISRIKHDVELLKRDVEQLKCDHPIEERIIDFQSTYDGLVYSMKKREKCIKCGKIIRYFEKGSEAHKRQAEIYREIANNLNRQADSLEVNQDDSA